MATATVILEGVGGHASPATVYKLDPPKRVGEADAEYVTVWIDPPTQWQAAEVVAIWSNERGAAVIPGAPGQRCSIIRRAGSYVLHDDYAGQPEYVAGAHFLALTMLGYAVEAARPQDAD